jgi:leucyl-tRNA synthetase
MKSIAVDHAHDVAEAPAPARAYAPHEIEARWREAWAAADLFRTPAQDDRPSSYVFAGCPFTSGAAHMGHVRSYTISDAYARYRRASGDAVLFSLGFDSFGLPAELEAIRRGVSPQTWVEQCCSRMREQFERLGYSCDWNRSFVSSDAGHYRWSQWLFLALLEHDLVYRREAQVIWCDSCETVLAALQADGGACWRCGADVRYVRRSQWFLRVTAYLEDNERGLELLQGWDKASLGSQRAMLGRVDGFEFDVDVVDGGRLTVFSPHAEAPEAAAFVAVSPAHPEIDAFIRDPAVAGELLQLRHAGWRRSDRSSKQFVHTRLRARVPATGALLPILVAPHVDQRYGPTAVFGCPALDDADRAIARKLGADPVPGARSGATCIAPRPAVRYRAQDFPISRQRPWGAPIPLVHCPSCGTVPVPREQLPVVLPAPPAPATEGRGHAARDDLAGCACPRCAGATRRETDTLDCHVDALWMWMPIAVPSADRDAVLFDHPELRRWLPVKQIVWGADAGGYLFDQRITAKALQDIGVLAPLDGREPFENALMHQMIRMDGRKMSKHLGNVVDPSELVDELGADVVRLAVLAAAAPAKAVNWTDGPLREAGRFVHELWWYAEPRLRAWTRAAPGASAPPDPLRAALARWRRNALARMTAAFDGLELQRAARNAMRLLPRIQEFEQRTIARRGGPDAADREAIASALSMLVQALAPLTPHVAEELWSVAGGESFVSEAAWPTE